MARGRFITLEGGEGAGKSAQAARLAAALRGAGLAVLETREPGGAPGAEAIRDLLVRGAVNRWDPVAEALLHYAARRDHVARAIEPALAEGRWVVSDRFADSTTAYQGHGHGLPLARLQSLYDMVVGAADPDLTLVLDLPVAAGLRRARTGAEDRYERMGAAFHERVRAGFLAIARDDPARCCVIDAARPADAVAADVAATVARRLGVSGL